MKTKKKDGDGGRGGRRKQKGRRCSAAAALLRCWLLPPCCAAGCCTAPLLAAAPLLCCWLLRPCSAAALPPPALHHQESRKQNIFGCWPCFRKHFLKYYYDKRDILLDTDSQGVLEQEVPSLDSCNGLAHNLISIPRLPVLRRHLIGEGSHRRLHSSMRFDFPSDADSILSLSSCEAVIIERLPLGVFADPFELQHLVQRGVFVDAAVFGDTNLELPSALSNWSAVEIHMGIHGLISSHHKGVEIALELPLHARYPPLEGSGGYSRVDMGLPDVLMRCVLGKERGKHCLWVSITHEGFIPDEVPIWQIPCGSSAHSGFVSTVTFASAFASVLVIVLAARSYSTSTLE